MGIGKTILIFVVLFLGGFFLLSSFGEDDKQDIPPIDSSDYIPSSNPQLRGDRLIGLDLTNKKDGDFPDSLQKARQAGIGFVQVSFGWSGLEKSEGVYTDPLNILQRSNDAYSEENIKVALNIVAVNFNARTLPAHLSDRKFNDPFVIQSYKNMIDWVFDQLSDVEILTLATGNEIGSIFQNDAQQWVEFTEFHNAIVDHIHQTQPGVDVGVKIKFDALLEDQISLTKTLNQKSDVILVTYYPLQPNFNFEDPSVVRGDLNRLTSVYSKPIYFLEAGYSTASFINADEEQQREFYKQIFIAWDEHKNQIKGINILWLHDLSLQTSIDVSGTTSKNAITEYIRTLGLFTYEGREKLAWESLKIETSARGF